MLIFKSGFSVYLCSLISDILVLQNQEDILSYTFVNKSSNFKYTLNIPLFWKNLILKCSSLGHYVSLFKKIINLFSRKEILQEKKIILITGLHYTCWWKISSLPHLPQNCNWCPSNGKMHDFFKHSTMPKLQQVIFKYSVLKRKKE